MNGGSGHMQVSTVSEIEPKSLLEFSVKEEDLSCSYRWFRRYALFLTVVPVLKADL